MIGLPRRLGPAALCLPVVMSAAFANSAEKARTVIPIKAEAFSLFDVRLLDGPFKHAQELDRRYLLSLDPERLLHNFRVNAGLPSTARPLGGWEAPDCELRGHFVGHYLSACARMYAATGDTALKERAAYVVGELAKCQAALKNGYLSAFPESFIDRVERRERVWAPWYTLHKILAGLIDAHQFCDDPRALEMATRFADWARRRTDRLTDEQMQAMLQTEHGGMNEALANLYAVTGKKDYLALAERFNHHAVLDPLSKSEDHLSGLHANTQIPKVIGAAREYELTGDISLRTAADFFWNTVTKERSYVIGGNSDGEMFSPKEHLSRYLSAHTTETCNTYNMLKLTRHLFMWNPKAPYVDYFERALYNHILASQNPETGMMCYYVPLRPGSRKEFSSPNDSFWCCTGTGVENHAQYGDSIYFHTDRALYVNLFVASDLNWKAKGLRVRQETQLPSEPGTRLSFTCQRPVDLALRIRRPSWAGNEFGVRVNGRPVSAAADSSGYVAVTRRWVTGDSVEVALPMDLHTEAFRDDPNRFAFLYGPIVLAGTVRNGRRAPVIVSRGESAISGLRPTAGKPLQFVGNPDEFRSLDEGSGESVQFGPFYSAYDDAYAVYYDRITPEEFEARRREHEAEVQRQKEFAARTVDSVAPGEPRSEREHHYRGETSYAGDFGNRHWRDARSGGWFSYEMKVEPGVAQDLVCTYWGGDGGREFDVLVDGVKLATQRLTNAHPGEFFDEVYAIPTSVLDRKTTVTARFQGAPGRTAGGVFGCMILRRNPGPPPGAAEPAPAR